MLDNPALCRVDERFGLRAQPESLPYRCLLDAHSNFDDLGPAYWGVVIAVSVSALAFALNYRICNEL